MVMEYEESYTRKAIYRFLVDYITQNGYPPSLREICDEIGINSTSSVHHQLAVLEDMGMIKSKRQITRLVKISIICHTLRNAQN